MQIANGRLRCAKAGFETAVLRRASRSSSAAWTGRNFSNALTPSSRSAPWADSPRTVRRNDRAPACAGAIVSPVGSITMAASARTPCSSSASVPQPPSSSPITGETSSGPGGSTPASARALAACKPHANPPFMSTAPRPYSRPSDSGGVHGDDDQSAGSPAGTTSTWPLSSRLGPPPLPRRPSTPSAPLRSTSTLKCGCAESAGRSISHISTLRPASRRNSAT